MYEFYIIDTAVTTDGRILTDQLNPEFFTTLNLSGLPLTKLQLKIGASIILLWNLNLRQGLYNKTRLLITKYTQFCIEAQTLSS